MLNRSKRFSHLRPVDPRSCKVQLRKGMKYRIGRRYAENRADPVLLYVGNLGKLHCFQHPETGGFSTWDDEDLAGRGIEPVG